MSDPSKGHRNTKELPIAFPRPVIGYISPYQTVVIVTSPHQRASNIEAKLFQIASFSTKYTKKLPRNRIIK
jgi:hypothetical protein